jgi:Rps23 Pro-64 3,4-dihydroxylase Tpa1-like proline 4-hydroxylase
MMNQSRDKLYAILDTLRADLSGNDMFDIMDNKSGELVRAAPALDKSLSELLYAYYPKGGFYRRHTDAVQNSASVLRSYSLLLYLNNEWEESDGGHLRVHLDSGADFLPEGEKANYVDVKPEGGTLVLFKSDQIPHEVLDTNAERTAIVGWYNRPYTTADISSLASEEDKKRGMMLMAAAGLVTVGVGMIIAG